MKKIYSLIGIFLLCSIIAFAQSPANRTAKTIVADVLAQMPAQRTEQYNEQMKDLSSAGEAGVLELIKMMNPPGKGSNASVEYALSGLSHYVSKGNENERLTVSSAYIKALDMINDNEIKAFIISQLGLTGKDEVVSKLSTYLNDAALSSPSARVLASINSPSAGKALLEAMGNANDASKKNIIEAMGQMQLADAEMPLKALVGEGDANMQKVVLYALSRTGTVQSLPELKLAAEKAGFTMEPAGATEAYIALIKRVLSQGKTADAEKAAKDLMKKAEKAGKPQARKAALEILMAANPSSVQNLLKDALKDKDNGYRYAALEYASNYADSNLYTELIKSLKKAKSEVQLDILNWFGEECSNPEKREMIGQLGNEEFISILTNSNPDIKDAAAQVLSKTSGDNAIKALAYLLNDADEKVVAIAKDALSSTKGDISAAIIPVIATANTAGKVAGLELLATRKSTDAMNTIMEQTKSETPAVKAAAYAALKDVVSDGNLSVLYGMLESAPADAKAQVQQAIVAAMKSYPPSKQLETVTTQMSKVSKDKQYLYYPVLAATGESNALKMIVDKFATESGDAKDAAFQALLSWKGLDAAGELYTICKDPSASQYFDKAISRYIQLASTSELTGENRRLLLAQAMEVARTDTQKNQILDKLSSTDSYLGMLLAGQYLDSKPVQQAAANAVMNIALNNKNYTGKPVEALLNKVIEVLNNPDAEYQRQAIRKHLNEMPKEEGFVSIFNGKDLTGWKGLVGNPITRAKMKAGELAKNQAVADEAMRRDWTIKDGLLIFDGKGYDNLCTIKQYGDIEMYIDWNLDPSGKEADAGVYLRGTPQVQIWDIARINSGAQVGSGGLYNNQSNPSKPLKVADNKLGEWNTLYIKMVGDRVTVKLNGELVVDNVILENYWDRKMPIFPLEQIELQAHGSKVYFRNIYVKELKQAEPFRLSAEEKKEGFKVLFDGTNMHQWQGNTVDYVLEDGCISMHPSRSFGGNLYTKDEYSNFVYRFEFQMTPAANNGVGIRTPMGTDAAYDGMEIQILDHDHAAYKNITPLQVHGSVYGIIGAKRVELKPVGEWNQEEIIADGDHIKVTLNGEVILDGNIREATRNGTADKQDHPGLFNPKGYIGFLGHGAPIKFRNIRIKELK